MSESRESGARSAQTRALVATLDSAISFEAALLTDAETRELKRALSVPNPAAKPKPGARFNREPPELCYLERVGDRLVMPRGFAGELRAFCERHGIDLVWEDRRVAPGQRRYSLRRTPRQYQVAAARAAIAQQQGLVVAPCGAGKTTIALLIIASLGRTTLVLVMSLDQLAQLVAAVVELLGVEPGVCADGRVVIGPIVIAMVQTVSEQPAWLDEAADYFGVVIVDEAHHAAAPSLFDVVSRMRAKFRIGLTATPHRGDGLTSVVEFLLGPVVHEITFVELEREGVALRPERRVVPTDLDFEYFGPEDWAPLLAALASDTDRNDLVIDTVARECVDGAVGLLLTNRVALAEQYAERLRALGISAAAITGKTPRKARAASIEAARAGELAVLVATQLADEGLDVPSLSRVFLTAPSRSESRLVQRIGRILRPHPSKGAPVVFDFVDMLVGPLAYQARLRERAWRETWGDERGYEHPQQKSTRRGPSYSPVRTTEAGL